MPVCSLFLKQQLTLLSPSQYRSALALPDRSVEPEAFDIALSSAGLGVRAVCALPRMGSTGGYPGSAGNAPNIVACIFAIILGIVLASLASKRAAAVARWEIRTFFIVFSLQYLFQLLSTGKLQAFSSMHFAALMAAVLTVRTLALQILCRLVHSTRICGDSLGDGDTAWISAGPVGSFTPCIIPFAQQSECSW